MTVGERAKAVLRWITTRRPITYLIAGWVVFFLGSYPGYLSLDSILQLYSVRSGEYTDYAPVMTAVWAALEYVTSGPFPMLVLQSGLCLFGLDAILRTMLSPRAAAVTAAVVLLFPPVFAPLAVIWPDSLLTACLLAGTGAILDPRRGWKIVGGLLFVIACACRPEAVVAVVPLVCLATPRVIAWRRLAIAIGITIGIASFARVADWALTTKDLHAWRQGVMMPDVIGTLRRAKVKDEAAIRAALGGLRLADPATLRERVTTGADALDWWALANGDKRILEPIATDDDARALWNAWRRTIGQHPGAYLTHRWAMTRSLLGISGAWDPIYDQFGDPELMAPLHHRATSSDWQYNVQKVVRAVGKTPLFRPWLYLLIAIGVLVVARRRPILRAVVASGLAYELVLMVFAQGGEYRYSHWLVTASCAALAAMLVARKSSWTAAPP